MCHGFRKSKKPTLFVVRESYEYTAGSSLASDIIGDSTISVGDGVFLVNHMAAKQSVLLGWLSFILQ
jgi:hypothetical protein